MVGEHLKDTLEKAMGHEHARGDYINYGDALFGCNGLEYIFALGRRGGNARAFASRVARVKNQHGNVFLNGRQQRGRMQDLCAEIGKLRRFFKANVLDAARVWTEIRI